MITLIIGQRISLNGSISIVFLMRVKCFHCVCLSVCVCVCVCVGQCWWGGGGGGGGEAVPDSKLLLSAQSLGWGVSY